MTFPMRIIELRLGSFCDYLMVVALSKVFEIEKHVGILLNIKNIYRIPGGLGGFHPHR